MTRGKGPLKEEQAPPLPVHTLSLIHIYNCAQQAKVLLEEESPERNVHVFNSCSASSGEVLIALKIQELAASGMPFKHVVREVEQFIYRMQTLFVLESLENLRKNGRLTKMQAVVTSALRIKLFCGATPVSYTHLPLARAAWW